jgi:hypothetical protein
MKTLKVISENFRSKLTMQFQVVCKGDVLAVRITTGKIKTDRIITDQIVVQNFFGSARPSKVRLQLLKVPKGEAEGLKNRQKGQWRRLHKIAKK